MVSLIQNTQMDNLTISPTHDTATDDSPNEDPARSIQDPSIGSLIQDTQGTQMDNLTISPTHGTVTDNSQNEDPAMEVFEQDPAMKESIRVTLQLPKDINGLCVLTNQATINGTVQVLTNVGASKTCSVYLYRRIKCLGALVTKCIDICNDFFEDTDGVSSFDFQLNGFNVHDTFHGIPNQNSYGYTMRYFLIVHLISSSNQDITFEQEIKVEKKGVLPMTNPTWSLESNNGCDLFFPRSVYLFNEEMVGRLRANLCIEDFSEGVVYKSFEVHLNLVITGKIVFWSDGKMKFGKTYGIQNDSTVSSVECVVTPRRLGSATIVSVDSEVIFKLNEFVLFPSANYNYFTLAYKLKVYGVFDKVKDLKGEKVVTLVRG